MKNILKRKKEADVYAPTETYRRNFKRNWQLYLMVLLPFIYVIIFEYFPMYGAQIAFKKFTPKYGIWNSPWVGLDNLMRFIKSIWFERTMFNTLILSVYSLVVGTPITVVLALLINAITHPRLKKTVQMATYLPHFISTVVIVGMMGMLFGSRTGLIGKLIFEMTGGEVSNIMGSPTAFRHMYVWSGVWQGTGWGTIIYLANLSNVSGEQIEAAIVDGANRFKQMIYVEIPAIMPTFVIQLIMSLGGLMSRGYEKALLMQNPLNLEVSEIISTYSYKVGLVMGSGDYSFGAAIGLFNSVINFILLLTVNKIAHHVSETSLW